jgi:hypothetical protein
MARGVGCKEWRRRRTSNSSSSPKSSALRLCLLWCIEAERFSSTATAAGAKALLSVSTSVQVSAFGRITAKPETEAARSERFSVSVLPTSRSSCGQGWPRFPRVSHTLLFFAGDRLDALLKNPYPDSSIHGTPFPSFTLAQRSSSALVFRLRRLTDSGTIPIVTELIEGRPAADGRRESIHHSTQPGGLSCNGCSISKLR